MTAHVAYPALDAVRCSGHASRRPIMAELRERLGFDGLVVTDALIMDGALMGRRESDAAVEAIQAGVDLLLYPKDARRVRDALEQALASGALLARRGCAESLRRYERALAAATSPTPPVTRGPFESADALADALLAQGMLRGAAPRLRGPLDLVIVDDDLGGPYPPGPSDWTHKALGRGASRPVRRRLPRRARVRRAARVEGPVGFRRNVARRARERGARRRADRAVRPPAARAGAADRRPGAARVASPAADAGSGRPMAPPETGNRRASVTLRWLLAAIHLLALGIGLGAVWARARSLGARELDLAGRQAGPHGRRVVGRRRIAVGGVRPGAAARRHRETDLRTTSRTMRSGARWRSSSPSSRSSSTRSSPSPAGARPCAEARCPRSGRPHGIARISYIQTILVMLMVLAATAMARGLG